MYSKLQTNIFIKCQFENFFQNCGKLHQKVSSLYLSVIEEMNAFDKFSLLSGLKLNKTKCEIASIGILKGVLLALCGMDCIDLTKTAIQILGMHYKKKLETEENFMKHVQKIEKVLKLWRM